MIKWGWFQKCTKKIPQNKVIHQSKKGLSIGKQHGWLNKEQTSKQYSRPVSPNSFKDALRDVQGTLEVMYMASAGSCSTQSANSLRMHGKTCLPNHWNRTGQVHDIRKFTLPIESIEIVVLKLVAICRWNCGLVSCQPYLRLKFCAGNYTCSSLECSSLHIIPAAQCHVRSNRVNVSNRVADPEIHQRMDILYLSIPTTSRYQIIKIKRDTYIQNIHFRCILGSATRLEWTLT